MAYSIQQDNPDCDGFAVVDDDSGELESCHMTEADAQAQCDNLNANGDMDDEMTAAMPNGGMMPMKPMKPRSAVRDHLVRSLLEPGAVGIGEGNGRTLFGYMARFNSWTEINNPYEGRFLERIAPGAFTKTLREGGKNVKILFNHGKDPSIGMKPLGPVTAMREDDQGLYYEVELLDAPYIQDVAPAAKAGLLGSSFQFSVPTGRDEWVDRPKRSGYNPEALPERTIRECRLYEGGPVTFPAYADATAGVRSLAEAISGEIRLSDEQRDEIVQAVLRTIEERAAIAVHHTATVDGAWDGPAVEASLPNDASVLRYVHAWRDSNGDPTAKGSYKFPHHDGAGKPANLDGVRNALARLSNANIPDGDRAGVEAHLQAHLSDAKRDGDPSPDAELRDFSDADDQDTVDTSDVELETRTSGENAEERSDATDDISDAAISATDDAPAGDSHPPRIKTTQAERRMTLLKIRKVIK